MDTAHKQEYKVRDLTTRSVTLFPSRAQVVRELKDVSLKPGVNEITVIGLTPTVDEHSIKVEGTGLAVISNITVELQSNRDIYEDIYPDSDNDSDETSDEEQILDPNASQEDAAELQQVRQQLVALRDEQTRAKESLASAENRLKILDAYGKHMAEEDGTDIVGSLDKYRTEREKVFDDHMTGVKESRDILLRIEEATKVETRLVAEAAKAQRKAVKAWLKAQKTKQTEQTKKDRRKAEQQKEKARVRTEREKFWPRQCYAVCITLDATAFTPMSSRRNSVSSDLVKVPVAGSDDAVDPSQLTCDLVLSYVTTAAFWSPSYDLQLSTTTNTATLCFDAQLTNKTSETWSNCKIVLSTSQASFSGIADAIPTLAPWRIKLATRGTVRDNTALLASREELREKESWQAQRKQLPPQQSRNTLFGRPQQNPWGASHGWSGQPQQQIQQQMQQQQMQHQSLQSTAAEVFGAPEEVLRKKAAKSGNMMAVASSSFAPNARSAFPPPPALSAAAPGGGSALHASAATSGGLFSVGGGGFGSHASRGGGLFASKPDLADDETEVNVDVEPELDFEESAMEETGLTTTYDLSNSKTLAPRSTASKQRVVRLTLPDVVFSHTVVAKYRPVAYLKARLRNISKMTLLRGPTGLTLDGAFMGRTNLPRCSPGDSFSLSLGVDPAVKVLYPKPEVRRGTTGIFKVENSGVYTRAITLINTRSSTGGGKAIRLLVHDQIPVSEDERLKVEILQPNGLSVGGGGVGAGAPTRDGKEDRDWGTAVASLKKEGEVSWDVGLKAGRGVRLGLEYVVALPGGEHAVQCQEVGKTWTQMNE